LGQSKACTTIYEYNNLGNITKETKQANTLHSRVVQKIYDPTGIYLTEIKNPLGQSQFYSMDNLHNVPLQFTDVNGLITYYNYDGWARRVQTILPNGKEINEEFEWNPNYYFNNDFALYYHKISSSTNSKEQFVFYDALGRELRKSNDVAAGKKLIESNEYITSSGDISKKHFRDGSGNYLYGVQYTYDAFHRVTQASKLYGSNGSSSSVVSTKTYTKFGYIWKEEETIGAKTTLKHFNRRCELQEASENGMNVLTYEYNNFGKNTKVKLGNSTLIESEFDIYGNQTKLTDKNASILTYEYNAFKELTKQTNSNGGNQRFQYDVLGRKTKELLPEGTINYIYFPNGSGASTNLIKEINGYNIQNKETYSYDNFGRLIEKKQYVIGRTPPYITSFQYDNDNNIIQKTNPSTKVFDYVYDAYGNLQQIKKGTISIFSLVELTSLGQLKKYNLCTTLVYRDYDDLQRLNKIGSVNFDEEYNWDNSNNNLLSKNDLLNRIQTNYTYDNLERLIKEEVVPQNGTTYNKAVYYEDNGNIAFKDFVGEYDYHTNKHNAVKSIINAENFSPYRQDVVYSSFNKPTKITQNNNELVYNYNQNLERICATLKKGSAIQYKRYFAGDVEFTYNASGTLTHSLDYIFWNNMLVAIDLFEINPMQVPIGRGGGEPVPGINPNIAFTNNSGIWYVQLDYQKNIRAVFKTPNSAQFDMSYDAWGNYRDVANGQPLYDKPSNLPFWIYRGYTSHEYLPEFRLYNMNARIYDPHIGRFLNPDNYVQLPHSLQSYNRYSYCINNPTKYNDPSGNFFIIDDFIIGTVRGIVEFVSSGFSDWGALTTGFVQAGNCAMIYGGLFSWSSTDNFWSALGRIASRLTYELPQTLAGVIYSQAANTLGQVESVGYAYGATVVRHTVSSFMMPSIYAGVTLGSYINGGNTIRADAKDRKSVV
jgi:RHS repeat-associated protein